jgi:ferredoxin
VLVAAVALAWLGSVGYSGSVVLPALSPFVATGSLLAARAAGVVTLLAVPVLLLALWLPRWFCRYGCPTGFLQELLERLRPGAPLQMMRVPEVGKWLVAITFGGACIGYPVFLWLDPLALFNGFLNAWRLPLTAATALMGIGLPALLIFDLVFPRVWCQRLCPLGATQELLAWPRRWLRLSRSQQPPDKQSVSGPLLARRLFFGGCFGAAGAFLSGKARASSQPPLRPPGALDEARFVGVCIRCGNCAGACPSHVIRPDLGASGVAGLLTPQLSFNSDYCREDCHRCGQVCPSGAIARLPLSEKRRRVIGPARVDLETCLLANGRECTACLKRCPYEALFMNSPDGGFTNEPRVDLAKCTGCGACEAVCPVRPHRAIRVTAALGDPKTVSTRTAESSN